MLQGIGAASLAFRRRICRRTRSSLDAQAARLVRMTLAGMFV